MSTVNLFIKIDGVEGTTTDVDYKGWIAIEQVSNGHYRSASISNDDNQTSSGAVHFGDIGFSKSLDAASTKLFELVTDPTSVKKVIIARSLGKGKEMARWTYTDCNFTAYSMTAGSSDVAPFENIGFSFATVAFETKTFNSENKETKYGPVSWNKNTNAKD